MPSLVHESNEKPFSLLPPVTIAPTTMKYGAENPLWLYSQFELESDILLLDCRPYSEYCQAHVEGAINLHIPSLILRRLQKGNLPLSNLLHSEAAKAKFERRTEYERIIIYDETCNLTSDGSNEELKKNPVLEFLLRKLSEDNKVCYLDGGYRRFEECYPHLCQCGEGSELNNTVLSLAGLKLVDTNNNQDQIKDEEKSKLSIQIPTQIYTKEARLYRPDCCSAVQILPRLYLGSKVDASNWDELNSKVITHVLNVTDDLPNYFEDRNNMNYLQLSVQDNWSGNLGSLFDKAFDFIDTARDSGENVLVHCVGGISRSSTVIIAYIMVKHNCSLNDAYDFVKQKKSNVAPNVNFMGQLMDFERSRSSDTPSSRSSISTLSTSPSFTSDCECQEDNNVLLLASC